MFANPLENVVLGDPFIIRVRGRFYLYGTNDGPALEDSRAIPVYRSDDMLHWTFLGGAIEDADPTADYWAPEVLAWNGRFWMAVSLGDVDRRGHALWIAVSERPEGPFRLRARVSELSEPFSIDGSWLLDDDGGLYLFRCADFVGENDLPHGTGIVVQPMRDPITPAGVPVSVLRGHSPWHVFERDRTMTLYGGRTFPEWYTIEGPAPIKRAGRYFCGYSGGNYGGDYGTGEAVADHPLGPYQDLRGREGPLLRSIPGMVEGPGHFSVIRPDMIHDWVILHGRRPGEPVRRVWLCPAQWGPDGVLLGKLTDREQESPPLPNFVTRFDEIRRDLFPDDWRTDAQGWRITAEGMTYAGEAPAIVWCESLMLSGDWVVEVHMRVFPSADAEAGIAIRSAEPEPIFRVRVSSIGGVRIARGDADGRITLTRSLPVLGSDPFDWSAFHQVEIRREAGEIHVRVDGVLVGSEASLPLGSLRLGLYAQGFAVFAAVLATANDRPMAARTSL